MQIITVVEGDLSLLVIYWRERLSRKVPMWDREGSMLQEVLRAVSGSGELVEVRVSHQGTPWCLPGPRGLCGGSRIARPR